MNFKEIKKLEKRKKELLNETEKTENQICKLLDQDMKKEFLRLKKEVEKYNKTYNGSFTDELQESWDKSRWVRKSFE